MQGLMPFCTHLEAIGFFRVSTVLVIIILFAYLQTKKVVAYRCQLEVNRSEWNWKSLMARTLICSTFGWLWDFFKGRTPELSQEPISAVLYKAGVSSSHSLIVSPHWHIGQLLEADLVYMQNAQPQSCPVCCHHPLFSYFLSVPGKQGIWCCVTDATHICRPCS